MENVSAALDIVYHADHSQLSISTVREGQVSKGRDEIEKERRKEGGNVDVDRERERERERTLPINFLLFTRIFKKDFILHSHD